MQKRMRLFVYSFLPLLCLSLVASTPVFAEDTAATPTCTPMTEAHKAAADAAMKKVVGELTTRFEKQSASLQKTFEGRVERLKNKQAEYVRTTRIAALKKVTRSTERTAVQDTFKSSVTPLLESFETAQTQHLATYTTDSTGALKTLLTDPLKESKDDLQAAADEALTAFKGKCDEDFKDAKNDMILEIKSDRETFMTDAAAAVKAARQRLTDLHQVLVKNLETGAFTALKKQIRAAEQTRDGALKGLRTTPTQGTPTQGTPTQGTPTQGHTDTPTQG